MPLQKNLFFLSISTSNLLMQFFCSISSRWALTDDDSVNIDGKIVSGMLTSDFLFSSITVGTWLMEFDADLSWVWGKDSWLINFLKVLSFDGVFALE